MALNIKNLEVEQLALEVSELTKESKTEAIRKALQERKLRLVARRGRSARGAHILEFLQGSIWSSLPQGLKPISKEEEAEILGFGSGGY